MDQVQPGDFCTTRSDKPRKYSPPRFVYSAPDKPNTSYWPVDNTRSPTTCCNKRRDPDRQTNVLGRSKRGAAQAQNGHVHRASSSVIKLTCTAVRATGPAPRHLLSARHKTKLYESAAEARVQSNMHAGPRSRAWRLQEPCSSRQLAPHEQHIAIRHLPHPSCESNRAFLSSDMTRARCSQRRCLFLDHSRMLPSRHSRLSASTQ